MTDQPNKCRRCGAEVADKRYRYCPACLGRFQGGTVDPIVKRSARLFDRDGQQWLKITLDGRETDYLIEDLRPDPRVAFPAFRLLKDLGKITDPEGGEEQQVWLTYDISRDRYGISCTCPDQIYRKDRRGERCKHISALVALGLIPKE